MAVKRKNTKKQKSVKSLIGGTILTDDRVTKQIPFLFFLAFFGFVLITNRNWSERTIRQIEVLQDTIKNIRANSITYSAELMSASKPSEIFEKVKEAGIDLHEQVRPRRKLIVEKEK